MVTQFITALERPVSRVRLENYHAGGTDLDMVVNYFHNLELSAALYPSLQAFEIALRNSIHLTLSQHFQTFSWFDQPAFLPQRQRRKIIQANTTLSQAGKPHEPNRIIAELDFGFWHSMFNSPFERDLWRPNRSALVGEVFPQAPKRERNRQGVWNRVDHIRIIRNRVMHYEPIWHRTRLMDDHSAILEALGWISRDMHDTITMCDRFLPVHGEGRADMEKHIQTEIAKRYTANGHVIL